MYYNYKDAIKEDIREWMRVNDVELTGEINADCENLCSEMWAEDSVTGNGVWGYDEEEMCLKYLSENLPLVREVALEMAIDMNQVIEQSEPAKKMDAIIRCALLDGCVWEVLNDN